jgi:uncharacterized membrane protein
MAMSLMVPLFPCFGEEIAISFGTGALVTSIALIATGFTQGMRSQIAYYQEAIIVQMAGMGTGPAALAWLNDEPDSVFFALTILYAIVMAGYLFYTVAEQRSSSNPVINCFLDDVPGMYGKKALKIGNSIIIGVSLFLMVLVIVTRRLVNRWWARHPEHHQHRRAFGLYRSLFTFVIFIAETVLAVLINLTMNEYGKFVSSDDRAAISAWQFGQIIPLIMLLGPFMDVIRALKEKFLKMREKPKERERQAGSESPEGTVVKTIISSNIDVEAAIPKIAEPEIKEVEVTQTEEGKEVEEKTEIKAVESKEIEISEETSKRGDIE